MITGFFFLFATTVGRLVEDSVSMNEIDTTAELGVDEMERHGTVAPPAIPFLTITSAKLMNGATVYCPSLDDWPCDLLLNKRINVARVEFSFRNHLLHFAFLINRNSSRLRFTIFPVVFFQFKKVNVYLLCFFQNKVVYHFELWAFIERKSRLDLQKYPIRLYSSRGQQQKIEGRN